MGFSERGTLDTTHPDYEALKVEIPPVSAKIGPYAKVWVGGENNEIDFGFLVGKAGVYTANGDYFYEDWVKEFFTGDLVEREDCHGWGGTFWIETNTDVQVAFNFEFEEGEWLESPTVFGGVHRGAGWPYGDNPWPTIDAYVAWNWVNFENPDPDEYTTSFVHEYQFAGFEPGEYRYDINGAIWIETISQQRAGEYTGNFVVTVSLPGGEQ